MKNIFLHGCCAIKTIVDSADFVSALFREFGTQPDTAEPILQLDEAFLNYFAKLNSEGSLVLPVAPGISILHICFLRSGQPHELIVTFSESQNELVRHNLLIVPVLAALAA